MFRFGLIALVVVVLVGAGGPSALSLGSTDSGASMDVGREVRTTWTSEHGLDHPAGVAYVPERREFIIVGSTDTALRLGPDEEALGTVDLQSAVNPAATAYDQDSGRLASFSSGVRAEWETGDLGKGKARRYQEPVAGAAGIDAKSAAFDRSNGDWVILTETDGNIVRISGDSPTATKTTVPLRSVVGPNAIAFNSEDDATYVLDGGDLLHVVDRLGRTVQSFDLTGVGLVDPVAMVFAPSSDTTDGATVNNLFVADSGGTEGQGGLVEVSLAQVTAAAAPVDVATLVRTTATSGWSPASPDPSGVAYMSDTGHLIVVDSEVDEATGAGWNNVNMWRTSRSGGVLGVGTFWGPNAATYNGKVGYSREPTGAGYDSGSRTLFVSDDSAGKVFVARPGTDTQFGTSDDVVSAISTAPFGSNDTEDPEFDVVTGHLFFLDGVGREIYRINPVDGVFGNSNDVMTHFDISHLGPTDFEALSSDPARGTLYVGARSTKEIFEITKTGGLVRKISLSGISGLRFVSGLAIAPASDGSSQMNFYVVDRAVDNGSNSNENDGKMFEVRAPDSVGGLPQNQPPVVSAGPDLNAAPSTSVALNGSVTDDGLPAGVTVTQQWSVVDSPSGGNVIFGSETSAATTASFSTVGTYILRLTASDTEFTRSDDVTVTVSTSPPSSDFTAVSQTPVFGTVVGPLSNTFALDGAVQALTEQTNSGGFRAKLEHKWVFNMTAGTGLTFVLNGSRSGAEDYKFAYSTNGSTWKNMTVSLNGSQSVFTMPSGISGTVTVRIKDTNRAKDDTVKDTVTVDRIVFTHNGP